ncbi:MAG TPA: hypothetical protein VL972_07540 [Solirubrobacteraceae bacterium]|nr:hypothetical protein [Solirubrobacteraceae bacterium]
MLSAPIELRRLLATTFACLVTLLSLAASASASSVTSVSATADTFAAKATKVADTVSFKATTALKASEGYVQLTAPSGTVFVDNGGYYEITDGEHFSYANAGVTVNPGKAGENVVDVYIPTSFSVAAGDTVTVEAFGVSNPTAANSGATLSVATSTDTTAVSKAFAITAATSPSELSWSASPATAGSTQAVYRASFKATGAIADGNTHYFDEGVGYVQLSAPSGTVFPAAAGDYEVIDGSHSSFPANGVKVSPGGAGENVVDVNLPSTFSVAAGDTVEVVAFAVKNPSAANGSGSASLSTSSDATAVSKSLPISAAASPSNLTTSASDTSAGATRVVYSASFKAGGPLTNGNPAYFQEGPGYIRLTGPAGSVLPANGGDYEVIDGAHSSEANAGVVLNPGGAGENVVDVNIPTSFSVAAGDAVEVVVFGAKNPASANAGATLSLATSSDVTPVSSPFPIGATSAVSEVKASANVTSANATQVLYTTSFKATGPLTNGNPVYFDESPGFIQLTAPAGAVFSGDGGYYEIHDGAHASAANAGVVVSPGGAGENVVDVYIPTSFSVAAGDTVTVEAYGVKNPTAADGGASLSVSTSSDVTPVPASFPVAAATAVSDFTSEVFATTYTERFLSTSNITSGNALYFHEAPGYVTFTAPAGAKLPTATGDYYFTVIGPEGAIHGYTPAAAIVTGETATVYVAQTTPIAAGDEVELTIEGLLNPPAGEVRLSTSSDATPVSATVEPHPVFGRCLKTANKGEGKFASSGCSSEKVEGDYEWSAAIVKPKFTATATSATIETAAKTKILCKGASESGEISGQRTVAAAKITLTGCELGAVKCKSSGAAEGEIASFALEGELGIEKLEKGKANKVALDLYPLAHAGAFFEFSCAATAVKLTGSLLVPVKADKAATTQKLKYKASKGVQKPASFAGEPDDELAASLNAGAPEAAGLTLTATATFEEAVEINAVL